VISSWRAINHRPCLRSRVAPKPTRRNSKRASTSSRSIRRGGGRGGVRTSAPFSQFPDQSVIFDPTGQGGSPSRSIRLRRPLARRALERLDVDRGSVCSIDTGSRLRHFGCSSTVPGMLGWSTRTQKSLREIVTAVPWFAPGNSPPNRDRDGRCRDGAARCLACPAACQRRSSLSPVSMRGRALQLESLNERQPA